MKFLLLELLFLQAATSADSADVLKERYVGGLRKGVESVVQQALVGEHHHTGKHRHHRTRDKNQNDAGPKGRLSFDDDDDFFSPEVLVSKDGNGHHHHHFGDKKKNAVGLKGTLSLGHDDSFDDDGAYDNDDEFDDDASTFDSDGAFDDNDLFKQEEVMVNKDNDNHRHHHKNRRHNRNRDRRNKNRRNDRRSKVKLSFDDDFEEAVES
eukprot:CCRYP_001573-RA/>CCRYP_001573-RA protein AED:0.02 eAED:0.02 QI:3345/1/1/1/0.5/0.33/3/594/208